MKAEIQYYHEFLFVFGQYQVYTLSGDKWFDLNLKLNSIKGLFLTCQMIYQGKICAEIIASDLQNIDGVGSDRNLSICKALNASSYLSGNGAKAYNDEDSFSQAGIRLVYNNYSYKPYKQLWGEFIPNLAAIDALFNIGPEAKNLIQ